MYYPNLMYPLSNSGGGGGGSYVLPMATESALGGIKAESAETTDTQAVRIGTDGKLYTSVGGSYTLPTATASALGGVKADAVTATDTQAVRIGADGKLYTKVSESYTLPVATSTVLGGIMADTAVSSDTQEVRINGNKLYTAAQVQSDWAITDITATDYIKNKPSIPDISNKQDKATIVTDTTSTDIVVTLAGNTEYYYGTLTSLNVTAAASGLSWLRFTSGTTATTVTATGFTWAGGTAPTIAASKTYELNIKDGYTLCLEY